MYGELRSLKKPSCENTDHLTHVVLLRGITRDAEVYPDPERFMPERFLDANGQVDRSRTDPEDVTFGFGRRFYPLLVVWQILY